MTLRRWCTRSLSLCTLFYYPVSKFRTTLHWTHHECFDSQGDRKRKIGQLPIKKRFKDSTISREDLDIAIAIGIKLALKEQQSTWDSVVASTVRYAVDSVLTPALRELRADIQATNNSEKYVSVVLFVLFCLFEWMLCCDVVCKNK